MDEVAHSLIPYVPKFLLDHADTSSWFEVDGTMVSADISGFTALSERLAGRGREGAEVLTDIVNSCFTGMIDDCERRGGDILRFGGDALLVLFVGAFHEQRACRAAVAMRRTISQSRRTHDGRPVRLGVSIGMHAGTHHLHVVDGGGFADVFVSGRGATATVDAESAAEAGQILVSHDTAARLPTEWLGTRTADGVVLASVRARASGARPDVDEVTPRIDSDDIAARFVPDDQRAPIAAGVVNEHRSVAIAFVKFAGTDRLEPGERQRCLQRLADIASDAARTNGVSWLSTDIVHDGGKLVLTAGAPLLRGADTDRLLRAVRHIVDADHGLDLRVGVHRGTVFAGDCGGPRRRTYTVMGDAMNLAARLMARAETGQVIVSRAAIEWATSDVEFDALEPFHVKGKTALIHAGLLGAVLGRRRRLDVVDGELFGREREIDTLDALARQAADGRGAAVLVNGEPGIGKSRLAIEIVRRRPSMRLVHARCRPYDRLSAHSVTATWLPALIGIDDGDDRDIPTVEVTPQARGADLLAWLERTAPDLLPVAPLLAPALGGVLPATAETAAFSPEMVTTRTLRSLVSVVRRALATDGRPTILLIDDVYRADDESRALIATLAELVAEVPLMLLLTSTAGDDLVEHRIDLRPLDETSVAQILDRLVGDRAVTGELVRTIAERSGGNPLFLRELVGALVEHPDAPVPSSLEEVVATRVDALEPLDRRLLRDASVLGVEVDIELLGRMLGRTTIADQERWDRLAAFLERVGPGTVRFRYDTYWRVIYEEMSFASRRAAHARAIAVIEAEHPDLATATGDPTLLVRLADHATRCGDGPRAWRYGAAAGDEQARRSLFGSAAVAYRLALGAVGAGVEVLAVCERAADAFLRTGAYDDAERALAAARRDVRDPLDRARLLRRRGEINQQRGEMHRAARDYRSARTTLDRLDLAVAVGELAHLNAIEAGLDYRRARHRVAWDHATAAFAQAQIANDPATAARAALVLHSLTFHLKQRGVTVEAPDPVPFYQRAGDLLGEARFTNNRAVDLYFQGRWDDAVALYRRAADLCVATGDVVYEATAQNNIAEILSDQGRLDEAEELFRAASRTWRSVGFSTGIALVEANLGRLATRRGRYDDAAAWLDASERRFAAEGATDFVDEVRLRRDELTVCRGDLPVAPDERHAAILGSTDLGSAIGVDADPALVAYARRIRSLIAFRSGDPERARTELELAVATSRSAELPFELAKSLTAFADLGGPAAEAARDEAAALTVSLGIASTTRC